MQPPIGVTDFRALIEDRNTQEEPYLFVDKSLFIKEVLDDYSSMVILITRPRRFGKTLNLSMLHHFFAKTVDKKPTAHLFNGLKIAQCEEYIKKHQGQYPVVFLTFKDIKGNHFQSAYEKICEVIRTAYSEHEEVVLGSSNVKDRDKENYELILNGKATDAVMKSALKSLITFLHQSYGAKPIVLIDEYDTPIQTAYVENYYKDMLVFIREFFGSGLKDNHSLGKAVLTGILRVAKESLFSGLNNLSPYSLLDSEYGEQFGFTETELLELLGKSKLSIDGIDEVKNWYNGYQAGEVVIYNPWSIVNYIKRKKLNPYWINTSDDALIKDVLVKSNPTFKEQFERLLKGQWIEATVDDHMVFAQLKESDSAAWTLLLMSGYLKVISSQAKGSSYLCRLAIPNREVQSMYHNLIAKWLSGNKDPEVFVQFIGNLLKGEIKDFEFHLKRAFSQIFSVHNIKGKHPEQFFHGVMLGLLACINPEHYRIDSDKEAGHGRYDILIAPHAAGGLGIVIEIKSLQEKQNPQTERMSQGQSIQRVLEAAAAQAIEQIEQKQYDKTPLLKNAANCLKVGMAFSGKRLSVFSKTLPIEQDEH